MGGDGHVQVSCNCMAFCQALQPGTLDVLPVACLETCKLEASRSLWLLQFLLDKIQYRP